MMFGNLSKWNFRVLAVCTAVGLTSLCGNTCRAQSAPADLSPDVQEVLTLSRQHMDDSVITNYIISTGKSYKLSAEDIIYLNSQGVSQPVISALLESGNNTAQQSAQPATPASAAPVSTPTAAPPPVDMTQPGGPAEPAIATPTTPAPGMSAPPMMPPTMPPGPALQDNFYMDGGLNPSLWQTQSPILSSLAARSGSLVSPVLAFSPSGMQMSGIGGKRQFMGIQSTASYAAPFSFSTTVIGQTQEAIPFEIYLISGDMSQWLSISGHLGGHGGPRGRVNIGFFGPGGGVGFGVPTGGPSADYGIWVNHTGNGQPLSALGNKIFGAPIAGVPYTIQVNAGPDGLATVTLLDPNHFALSQTSVPVGTGPFYVVLGGRDGKAYSVWQSVQLAPTGPPAVAAPVAAPVLTEPVNVPATPTLDYFQAQLAPYGTWINVPGYGLCWQPAVDPAWRPYYDGGHWEYTDAGWFWQSDYPWGDIAFHYGRWAYVGASWVWVPGYEYAPAWVLWRHDDADGYVGWAPLPPGAVFVNGGWVYNGVHVGVDFDFGMTADFFTFVGYDHFWDPNLRLYPVPHDRVVVVFNHSGIYNHYTFEHGRFVNGGIPRDRMEQFTHRDIQPMPMADLRHDEEMRNAVQRQDDIHNFNPHASQPNAYRGSSHQPQNNWGH
jgi:hypothetical protein